MKPPGLANAIQPAIVMKGRPSGSGDTLAQQFVGLPSHLLRLAGRFSRQNFFRFAAADNFADDFKLVKIQFTFPRLVVSNSICRFNHNPLLEKSEL